MPGPRLASFLIGAVALGTSAAAASAGTLSASDILKEYNAVVRQDVKGSCCDFEGPIVAGGNLSGAGTFSNKGASGLPAGYGTANIYGNASGSFNANGAKAYVGGSNTATFSGGTVHAGYNFPTPFSAFWNPLLGLSQSLSVLAANSSLPAHYHPPVNNGEIEASPGKVNGVKGIAVFDIKASDLADFASFSLDTEGARTVVVNVSGNYAQTANFQDVSEADRTKVIWNFFNATSLSLTEWEGTVLAPHATVHNSSPIEGDLVANTFDPCGELHYHPFTGDLSFAGPPPPPSPVPEPASVALLGFGVMGALALRRARRPQLSSSLSQ